MPEYTVAVKFKDTPVQYCGLYVDRNKAEQNAQQLREHWDNHSVLTPPTSIRIRRVTSEEFWNNQATH